MIPNTRNILRNLRDSLQDIEPDIRADMAAILIKSERTHQRGSHGYSKTYIPRYLDVPEDMISKAYKELFGSPFHPLKKVHLPTIDQDNAENRYFPADIVEAGYSRLYYLYKTGWLDLGWSNDGVLYIGRESWNMHESGRKKYVQIKRFAKMINSKYDFLKVLVNNNVIPTEKRCRATFIDTAREYEIKDIVSKWMSIAKAADILGISREQLRKDVKNSGIRVIKYQGSHLVNFDEVKTQFSQLPPKGYTISLARLRARGIMLTELEKSGAEISIRGDTFQVRTKPIKHLIA